MRVLDFVDGFTSSNPPSFSGMDASAITFIPYSTVESTNVQDALEEIIDEKVQEIVSTDNAIPRFDGVSGDLQDSGILVDDSDNVTFPAQIKTPKQDVATAASILQLSSAKTFVRLTGSTVTEIGGVLAGTDGQQIIIHNSSSAVVTLKHEEAGASASDRITFPDATDVEVDPDSSIELIYDASASRWKIKSGAGTNKLVGYDEVPTGVVNGTNPTFVLAQEPVTTTSLSVFIDGVKIPPTAWSISGPTITIGASYIPSVGQVVEVFYLSKGTPTAPPVSSGNFEVEYRTITALEETNKALTLAALPASPTKVLLDVISGSSQVFGADYSVSGSTLTWLGLGLDGVLVENDQVRIIYFS